MPNIKSAIKRVNTIKSKTEENAMIKTAYKTAIKNFNAAVEAGNKELADEKFKAATKAIDKAAQKGVTAKNTAARNKSRLNKKVNSME